MITVLNEEPFRSIDRSVVSVGNFDGVHMGHQALVRALVERARFHRAVPVVVTFEPHTRAVLNPQSPLRLLTTLPEKKILLAGLGVEVLVCMPFTKKYADMEPVQFVELILEQRLGAVEWVMGENHLFGKERKGSKNFLQEHQSRKHINVFAIALSSQKAAVVSSTQIRSCIIEGTMGEAVAMLGHPYLIVAERTEGTRRGTSLGFPTLNFKVPPSQKVIPPPGVYAAELSTGDTTWSGALYFGNCPTFGNRDYHFEFHALAGPENYPGVSQVAMLWIHEFVRADETFGTEHGLVEQVERDIVSIRRFFAKE